LPLRNAIYDLNSLPDEAIVMQSRRCQSGNPYLKRL